jgi:hypothetical protein
MLLLAVGIGWVTQRVQRQRQAVSRIVGYGGHVNYDYQFDGSGKFRRDAFGNALRDLEPAGPRWLRKLLGDDYFRTPVKVWLESEEGVGFIDAELESLAPSLESLPNMKSLSLVGSPITTHVRHFVCDCDDCDRRGRTVTTGETRQSHLPAR